MITQTIDINGVRLTVRRATMGDFLAREMLLAKLPQDLPFLNAFYFVRCAVQTTIESGLDWQPPSAQATPAEALASYEAWLGLDEELSMAWVQALDAVSRPLALPEQAPGIALTIEQRNDPELAKKG